MITLNYAAGFFDGKRGTFNCGGTTKIGADFKCFLRRAADSPKRTRSLDNFLCEPKTITGCRLSAEPRAPAAESRLRCLNKESHTS